MAGKSDRLANPNEPFGRIILIPFNGVTVVHRELMVEVVVSFAVCDEGGDPVVAGSVFVVERRLAEIMHHRVD